MLIFLKMRHKSFLIVLYFAFFFISNTNAQRLKKTRALKPLVTEGYVSVGFQANAMNYFGDIPAGVLYTRPGASVFVSRKLSPTFHARLGFTWGRIQADDFSSPETSGTYARNLHFRNDLKELSVQIVKDVIGSYGKHGKRAYFTPYFVAGIALVHSNPQAKLPTNLGNEWVDLQPLGTEGQGRSGYAQPYNKIQFVIPLGFGLKWKIDKRWDFGMEIVPRITFTDYLDDVSNEYPEMADLGNPLSVAFSNRTLELEAAVSGEARNFETITQGFGETYSYIGFDGLTYRTLESFRRGQSTRGNPNSKDFYFVTGFHLSYIVNVGLKCPQFR